MLRFPARTAIAVSLLMPVPAMAGKLPPNATPLTADEVTKLHSGNTGTYPTTDEFFAPDGSTVGVFGKPTVKSVFSGKWVVVGNTLCTLNGNGFGPKVYVDCNSFWHDGDKTLFQWSTHFDGSRADNAGGYYDATGTLKPGNLVAERYKAAGGT